MKFTATKKGMMKGYWRVVDENGNTVRSGFRAKSVAIEVAKQMSGEYGYGCGGHDADSLNDLAEAMKGDLRR